MALGRAGAGPRVITTGVLTKVTPRAYGDTEANRDKQRVGEVYATDYELSVGSGALVFVRAWDRDEELADEIATHAAVNQTLTVWSEIVKGSGSFGDSFEFRGMVTPDDLDRIASGFAAVAASK